MRQKQPISLKERLMWFAKDVREKADQLRPGPEQDELLDKARRADVAAHIVEWGQLTRITAAKVKGHLRLTFLQGRSRFTERNQYCFRAKRTLT